MCQSQLSGFKSKTGATRGVDFSFRIIAPLLFYSMANKWVQKRPYTIAGLVLKLLVPVWATDMKLLAYSITKKTINMRKTKDSRRNSLLFDFDKKKCR